MREAIVVRNLSKTFRRYHPDRPWTIQEALAKGVGRLRPVERFWGLRDVSFNVALGRTVGIVGANGSGKSTLLRLICGIGKPDIGSVQVNGRIGALLDLGVGFQPDLTGRENAIVCGILGGLTRREVLDRLDSIIAFAEIEEFIDSPLRTYSSGMQMRLAFSTAIHTDPEVLLIDEVLAVGDLSFQRKCLERINWFKNAGRSILIVSHQPNVLREMCDEALWLQKGRLVMQGDPHDVIRQYVASQGGGLETLHEAAAATKIFAALSDAASPAEGAGAQQTEEPTQDEASVEISDGYPLQEQGSIRISAVRMLDGTGAPISDAPARQPLRIEINYEIVGRVDGALFAVRISREDGPVHGFWTEASDLFLSSVEGRGHVAVSLGRLDLNGDRHVVDIACYSRDLSRVFDVRGSAASFVAVSDVAQGQAAPYRWEFGEARTAESTRQTTT